MFANASVDLPLGTVIGVVDGVGGWASHGVEPSVYARAWTSAAAELVEQNNLGAAEDVIIEATRKVLSELLTLV
jgi:hypothetical protein